MSEMALSMVFFMLLGGGTGDDLLDYMDADYYWQQQQVADVTAQAMAEMLEDDQTSPTQMLMAIRTLGEIGSEADIAKLEPLVDSKQPFVGQYAKRSIAWLKGVDPEPLPTISAEQLAKDAALLRHDATMAGQLRTLGGGGPVDLKEVIPQFPPDHWRNRQEVLQQANSGIYETVQMLGNARMDAISFSVSFVNDDDGPVLIIGRGQYDRMAVIDIMTEMDEGFKAFSIEDIEILNLEDGNMGAAFIMPSDELFIAMLSESGNAALPVDEIVDLLRHQDAQVAFGEEMKAQYDKIDHEKVRGWFATSIPPIIQQERGFNEMFGSLDSARLTAVDTADGGIRIEWVGEGSNADAVNQSVAVINGHLAEGRAEMREMQLREPAMAEMFKPMVEIMDSIQVTADGKNMTGGMDLPPNIGALMPMMFLGM